MSAVTVDRVRVHFTDDGGLELTGRAMEDHHWDVIDAVLDAQNPADGLFERLSEYDAARHAAAEEPESEYAQARLERAKRDLKADLVPSVFLTARSAAGLARAIEAVAPHGRRAA